MLSTSSNVDLPRKRVACGRRWSLLIGVERRRARLGSGGRAANEQPKPTAEASNASKAAPARLDPVR